ncbi:MAG: hypothetical protein FD139_727 [Methylocystaceae bacterium]|nr:MAG: hypothetical protein FD148_44 [Methylocystaceae bacterium]KAF0213977.1 MAG: hypothetical protein FD172_101 [Methylocystaceae bacterium]TXT46882.1 MAG: hypothetical protein FD139_727 [Methylocystaceae bacterium]
MKADVSHLPPLLAEIAEVAGLVAAVQLAKAKGGTECYIPARAPDDHWLVQCVGREAADKLCAHFVAAIESDSGRSRHGVKILLPLGEAGSRAEARRRVREALEQGKTLSEAARSGGVHQRTVQNIRARMKDKRQGSLF